MNIPVLKNGSDDPIWHTYMYMYVYVLCTSGKYKFEPGLSTVNYRHTYSTNAHQSVVILY